MICGQTISIDLFLFVDSPICTSIQPTVLGVAKNEHLEISCDVDANPKDLKFHWTFNNKTRNINYQNEDTRFSKQSNSANEAGNKPLTSYITNGTRSTLTYTPGQVTS